jgi:malate dehydrogenase (oxaloacetate-decarboxylating)(NADP+)
VGLGSLVSEAAQVTDRMFLAAARTLSELVTGDDLSLGRVYPALSRIREVSAHIAVAVAEEAYRSGVARRPRPDDLEAEIRGTMFDPQYVEFV